MAHRVVRCTGLVKPELESTKVITRAERRKKLECEKTGNTYVRPIRPETKTDREDYVVRLFLTIERDIEPTKKVPFRAKKVSAFAECIRKGIQNKMKMNL